MTEAEWDCCTDPARMLESLRDKASDRKLRLFAVACACRLSKWIRDEWNAHAVTLAARHADGEVTSEALQNYFEHVEREWPFSGPGEAPVYYAVAPDAHFAACRMAEAAAYYRAL